MTARNLFSDPIPTNISNSHCNMTTKRTKLVSIVAFIICLFFVFKSIFDPKEQSRNTTVSSESAKSVFDFGYILESSPCTSIHNTIMIVTSYAGHVELRSAHRRAFSSNDLQKLGVKRIFLLAKFPTFNSLEISQQSIMNEQFRFGDLVQGDFNEAYRNLTLKHIMGLRWAAANCENVKIIIKLDDDIVFNLNMILNKAENSDIQQNKDFLAGYVLVGTRPIRLKENKWYVTKSEYQKSFYPPFLSGWMYLTTPKTAASLVDVAKETPYFWIDDVYVTGILATKLNIKLENVRFKHMFLEFFELMDCCINDMVDKNIMCEYGVGPNGNDNNMIVKFNDAINMCNLNKCTDRPSDRTLNDTCISIKRSFPISRGIPVVNVLKL